jgi:TRAP-type uncharacterized transport system substrate-binding protein
MKKNNTLRGENKMKRKLIGFSLAIAMLGATPAMAETVGLGSTVRGGTSQIGKAIAAAISGNSGMQMRPQEMANTADYMPLVNGGEIEFGIANIVQTWFAYNGKGMSAGHPMKNLRMAAVLMPFRAGLIVPKNYGITTLAGLKGKRWPVFKAGSLGDHVVKAFLANGGMQNWMPGMYLTEVKPSPKLPGVEGPTNVMTYDYTFFASTATKNDTVYNAVKTLHASEKQLLATGPFWRGFHGGRMANKVDVPFHPGAIKFYKEIGIWKD